MSDKSLFKRRISLILIFCILFSLFFANLFRIHLAAENDEDTDNGVTSSVSTVVKATRGEIYDRNGKLLVTNTTSNNIIFDANFFPSKKNIEERVSIVSSLIKLMNEYHQEWIDSLPIKIKSGKPVFRNNRESDIDFLKSKDYLNLNSYATAENCMDALIDLYSLKDFSLKESRNISSVFYGLVKSDFSTLNSYVFAEDVSSEIVSIIKENSNFYKGVDVTVVSDREYVDGTLAPHIIGVVGAINSDEFNELKDSGYSMNDYIGKTGIEKAMESYLKGEDGEKVVTTDAQGQKQTVIKKEPEKGNAVFLTIDSDVQKAVQDELKKQITVTMSGLRSYSLAGACVVEKVKTGEVIAAASYPTYNLSEYWDKVDQLNTDSKAPLWNRAFQSIYTPGSTMKVCVAMAGLEEGIISGPSFTVNCRHTYTYYKDYQPSCLGYHGSLNVVNALYHSCNYFFYEVSRLLGIEKLDEYATMFGLGSKTGIEVSEAEGNLDSPSTRALAGESWSPGFTLQAGIGHGQNQFTPIQLCSYVQTVANRGTRVKATLIKEIKSFDLTETIYKSKKEVLSKADFNSSSWDLVKQGMLKVGDNYFKKACKRVAAKTGTTTVSKTINGVRISTYNGLVICYAPADNPEIAVSVIIEGAGSGGSVAPIAVAAINSYYGQLNDKNNT